jgi:hypothetical protein
LGVSNLLLGSFTTQSIFQFSNQKQSIFVMRDNRLLLTSVFAILVGTSLATAQTNASVQPMKKEMLPTINPETGARIVYYIPGQPVTSGAEFGIDVAIEYRVLPGFEDPAKLTDEEKMRREIERKKAYYESQGLNYEDASAPVQTSHEKEAVKESAKAQPAERKTVSPQ